MLTYTALDLLIRKGQPNDLSSLKQIADANRNAVGFLPRAKLAEAIAAERIFVADTGVSPVGFVVFRHRKYDAQTTLSDLCVAVAWRRHGIADALVQALRAECILLGRHYVRLKCPIDLEANAFYEQIGFQRIAVEEGRLRALNIWHLETREQQTE